MTDEQFKIHAQDNARVNAIGKIDAERVDFGDRINFQQRVSVVGLDPIPPEHKAHEWIDRTEPQRELLARLQTQKLIELVAVGGFGKSLLANWLFHQVRGEFERSLWLNFRKVPTFNEFARWVLQEIGFLIDDPRVTDEDLSVELVYRLTEKRCLLVLDQLEAVQNGNDRASFEQFLQTWYQRGRSSIVIVTTRSTFGINSDESFALVGLTDAEGSKFLAKQGISAIAERGFARLTQLANGHPLLLGLAASWVRQGAEGCLNETDLDFFQQLFSHYQGDSEAKVEEIFAVLFAELPERLRSLLLGVVVYRDAFGLEMAQAMLEDVTIEDLQTLSDRAFLRQESERWTLHPLMQGLVEQELKKSDRQRESHERAIAYFAANIQPWTGLLSDCAEKLEIFHHCCELGAYALASQVMDTCVDDLNRRGYYRELLPIYQQLTHAWMNASPEDTEEQRNLGWAWTRLGSLYRSLGQYQAAITAYEKAQSIFTKIDELNGQGVLFCSLAHVYWRIGQVHLAIEYYQKALLAQREISNQVLEASALNGLGNAYHSLGQHQQALNFYQQSLEIRCQIQDLAGQAESLNSLGIAYHSLGQTQQALNFYQRSLELDREIGDRIGEANVLMNLGNVYAELGEYQQALNFHQHCLEIAENIGDRNCEAGAFNNLGSVYYSLGQYRQAYSLYEQSLEIVSDIGNRDGTADVLLNLGMVYSALGQFQKALDFSQQSLEIRRKIGDREGEMEVLVHLGLVYKLLERYEQALNFYQQCLEIANEISSYSGEAIALCNLGNVYLDLKQTQMSMDFSQRALKIMREIGIREGEAVVLMNLGSAYYQLGQYQQAINFYQQSLALHRDISNRRGEADTLCSCAKAFAKYEPRRFEAFTVLQQARIIYTELNLDHMVEQCDEAIRDFHQIIATQQRQSAPTLPIPTIVSIPAQDDWWERSLPTLKKPRTSSRSQTDWIPWFCIGIAIVLLIAWLRK